MLDVVRFSKSVLANKVQPLISANQNARAMVTSEKVSGAASSPINSPWININIAQD